MSNNYKKFLRLLEKWPVDKTKQGRDLGQYLRTQLDQVLGGPNIVSASNSKLDVQFAALENLANNIHGEKYQRSKSATATGLTNKECQQVLSSEFLEYLNEEDKRK